jgi:hypothetical protein
MDRNKKPYRELRIMAWLLEYLGLVLILLGIGAALYLEDLPVYWRIGIGAVVVLAGVVVAAAGQIYAAFLDIRDDVHAMMQSTRRIELLTKENIDA